MKHRISTLLLACLSIVFAANAAVTHDGYTVYVDDQTGWENLYLYMWGDVNNLNGAWPGMVATGTETIDEITYKYFDMGAANEGLKESIIFNNGSGTQLTDFGYTINRDIFLRVTASGVSEIVPAGEVAGTSLLPAFTTLLSEQPQTVKVLSLNNSLIHYENEWQDDMFNQMATAEGKDATWTAHTNLGKSLQYHYDEGEGLTDAGTPSAKMLVRTEAWTHIILQEQTAKPRTNYAGFRESVQAWVQYIRTNCPNPRAVIILPINWAYNTDAAYHNSNEEFAEAYRSVAQEMGVVLCPVGVAYDQAYLSDNTILQTFYKDDRHPTQMATYLACCLEYATIFGISPADIQWAPATLSTEEATQVRTWAAATHNGFAQVVNQHTHTIHYELHEVDADGQSVRKIVDACDTTLTTTGEHVIAVSYEGKTYKATAVVDTAITRVVTYPSIAFSKDRLTYNESFDGIGGAEVDPSTDAKTGIAQGSMLPEGWRIERNTNGPRQVGAYTMAADSTMYIGGQSLASNAYNGTWNFGATGSADRAVGGLTTGVANGTRAINVMAHLSNVGSTHFASIVLSYDIEKYRSGNNAAGFTVQLYYSSNGSTWTSAGETFATVYPADEATAGSAEVPMLVTSVTDTLEVAFDAGTELYLAWNISVSSGDNCAGAPGYAIDNVAIECLLPVVPESAYHIYAQDETGWETLALYTWGTAELYGAWPGVYPLEEQEIEGIVYKVYPYNVQSAGSYNLIFNNGNNGLQTPDFTVTEAKDYYLVVTADKVYEQGTDLHPAATTLENRPVKYLKDGQILLYHNGECYTLLGTRIAMPL